MAPSSTPTKTTQNSWKSQSGEDYLQLVSATGTIQSWIDSTGTPQGNLAGGGSGITGTIAVNQIAFGTNSNTIGGTNDFKWESGAFSATSVGFTVSDSNAINISESGSGGTTITDSGGTGITIQDTGGGIIDITGDDEIDIINVGSGGMSIGDNSSVGMSIVEQGSGGIDIGSTGHGLFQITSNGGLDLSDDNTAGLLIAETGPGSLFLRTTSASSGPGIMLENDATTGGIELNNTNGSSGTLITDSGGAGIAIQNTNADASPGIIIQDTVGDGIEILGSATGPTNGVLIQDSGTGSLAIGVQIFAATDISIHASHFNNNPSDADIQGHISSVSGTTVSYSYATAFSDTPTVVVTPTTNAGAFYLSASSNTGFTVTYGTAGAQTFNYIVIGNPS